MTQTIQFDLVSPESKIVSEAVTMAVIPGIEGDFGVLNGHMPLVASVGAGVVEVYRDDMQQVTDRVFVSGGVADVTDTQCTLLAEQAVNVNDINKSDIQQQVADLQEAFDMAENDIEKNRLQKKLAVLNTMLQFTQ